MLHHLLSVLVCLVALPSLSLGLTQSSSEKAVSGESKLWNSYVSLVSSDLEVGRTTGDTSILSEGTRSFNVGTDYFYEWSQRSSLYLGGRIDYASFLLTHQLAGEDMASYSVNSLSLRVPFGYRFKYRPDKPIYLGVGLAPGLTVGSDVALNQCSGICLGGADIAKTSLLAELSVSYQWRRTEFKLQWSQALTDYFSGSSGSFIQQGVAFQMGYLW